ncbi:MAG: SUMF1/EgtB/PvdO family nonheme iron enzyme [Acidobacteria bacterium]|nr:SUMF1/EgtB/PvdO family nonheme iron enzyme [Acidobacteriota bacterium]
MSGKPYMWRTSLMIITIPLIALANLRVDVGRQHAIQGGEAAAIGNPLVTEPVMSAGSHDQASAPVRFNAAWNYSWRNDLPGPGRRTPYNLDGLWIYMKFRAGDGPWKHATLDMAGVPGPPDFMFSVPADKKGVFLHRAVNGFGHVNLEGVELRWDHAADGVSDPTTVTTRVFAVEMVYIPAVSFYVGDATKGAVEGQFYAAGEAGFPPFRIQSEDPITLGGTAQGNLTSRGSDDFNASATQTLPASFPKGYRDFWIMKYELTCQQWMDFLNMLGLGQQAVHDTTASFGVERHAMTKSDSGFQTTAPTRPVNFMNFNDVMAFADWAGLRPMTELEYEKACRGPVAPVPDELAWGSTNAVQVTAFSGTDGSGTETALPSNANSCYNLQNGSSNPLDQPIRGPVRVGIFLDTNPPSAEDPSVSRQLTGASYWWVFELSGNVWERCVNISSPEARTYDGRHGDGVLSATGLANEETWPNLSGGGAGYRGGNWFRWTNWARVSSRSNSSTHDPTGRTSHRGIRVVRTAP